MSKFTDRIDELRDVIALDEGISPDYFSEIDLLAFVEEVGVDPTATFLMDEGHYVAEWRTPLVRVSLTFKDRGIVDYRRRAEFEDDGPVYRTSGWWFTSEAEEEIRRMHRDNGIS